LDVKLPVLWFPLAAFAPANVPPVAVQDVALVEFQVSVDAPPLAMLVGFALSVAVGMVPIVTVAVTTALVPPAPAQVSEYAALVVNAPVLWVPLVAFVPLQPPDAVHDVALVELQVSMEVPRLAIEVGFAVSVAVGTGAMVTVAVAAVLVPPVPVHFNVYVVLAVKGPVLWVPLAAFAPANVPPAAAHDVALVEFQVSVEVPRLAIEVGFAVSVAVGTGAMVTVVVAAVLVPPLPAQINTYVVLAVNAPVLWLPLAAFVPLQPPEAVHDVALVELQVSVEVPPLAIGVGLADSVAVGMVPIVTVAVTTALIPPGPVHVSE
jgi:hypothetical protein